MTIGELENEAKKAIKDYESYLEYLSWYRDGKLVLGKSAITEKWIVVAIPVEFRTFITHEYRWTAPPITSLWINEYETWSEHLENLVFYKTKEEATHAAVSSPYNKCLGQREYVLREK